MSPHAVNVMLSPSATVETQAAVRTVLSDAGLTGTSSTLEDKGLPDIPWIRSSGTT